VKDLITEIMQAQPRVLLMPKPLMNLESQKCPHCEVSLIAPEIPLIRISSRFDEATTLAWECPFCHEADVIPGMEARWAEFVKDYAEIWKEINASKDHEREVYARGPADEPYPGCYEAYKDDPECDDNHSRHQRGIALRFTESESVSVDLGSDGYDRSVVPFPVKPEDWDACNPGIPMPGTPEESGELLF
jgi:hypothetical protein